MPSARVSLVAGALACACGGGEAPREQAAGRPNMVFVLADDLGWRDVGYAGSAYPTPHIDALASGGLVFERAYAASPTCSPTRAAILTGRAPARIGLTRAIRLVDLRRSLAGETTHRPMEPESATHLPAEEVTFAQRLRDAGYATGFVGKWHLGTPPHTPGRFGFEWTSTVGYYSASPYFPPYEAEKPGEVGAETYLTDHLTSEALRFLHEHADRPFCLFVSHFAVHGPWSALQDDVAALAAVLPEEGDQGNAVYGAMIARLDASVGAIVAALDELGLTERTLLVFTSDNGPTLAKDGVGTLTTTAPLRGGKQDLYEGGLRVPQIIRWPGRTRPGTTTDVPVVSMDFFPTLLRAAGLEPGPGALDGLDLAPVLAGGDLDREALYFHLPHREMRGAVLHGERKLVFAYRPEVSELYDLASDPGEAHDLASERPEEAEALRRELFAWLERTGAGRVIPDAERRAAAGGG